jgi:hypothetical protein
MTPSSFENHVTVLGWINIALSAIFLFIGLFAFFFLTGIGLTVDDAEATRILTFVAFAGSAFFVALSIPGFLAGYGLLKKKTWGRVLAIVVAVLDLFNIPIGTAIGIYALWVLTEENSAEYFARSTA